jgi:diguanylate cyclase (GGDEF)-like protein/PAS domain S-box-containing protein
MQGTKLSNPDDAAEEPPPADAVSEAEAKLPSSLTAWLRAMMLAQDFDTLAEAVRNAPASVLDGCALELERAESRTPSAHAPSSGDVIATLLECDGTPAARLHMRLGPAVRRDRASTLLSDFARIIEAALENVVRLERARSAATPHEAYFEQLFSAAPEAIVVLDGNDRVVRVNHMFVEMFGYTAEEATGRTINELIVPEDLRAEALAMTQAVARGTQVSAEALRMRSDGSTFYASILGTPVVVHGNQVAVYGIYRDISAQKAAEEALRRLSTTDELTGLFNRRGFFMLAEQQRKLAVRTGSELLLLYIDIDDFKDVNDRFGHLEGDRVLADLGILLQHCYRNSDIIARVSDGTGLLARMGGDEFVVLAINPGSDGERILVSRLRERLEEYNASRAADYQISLSIGAVRVRPEPDSSIDSLLAAADRLMYRDKRQDTE